MKTVANKQKRATAFQNSLSQIKSTPLYFNWVTSSSIVTLTCHIQLDSTWASTQKSWVSLIEWIWSLDVMLLDMDKTDFKYNKGMFIVCNACDVLAECWLIEDSIQTWHGISQSCSSIERRSTWLTCMCLIFSKSITVCNLEMVLGWNPTAYRL